MYFLNKYMYKEYMIALNIRNIKFHLIFISVLKGNRFN